MTAALTASKYELASRCLGAFTRRWRDSPNTYSEAGNSRHAEDEQAINAGDIPDVLADRWPDHQWRAEVAYALDVATLDSREVGQGIGRGYGIPRTPFERFGTADAEGWHAPSRHLVIVDKKSFEAATAAAMNPQLRFLALAAAGVRKPDRITVAINHELTGLDVAELDAFEMDTIPHQLREIETGVAKARGMVRDGLVVPFSTGRWCRWCPAFDDCPQQKELLALARRDDDDPELAMSTTIIDDEDAPAVFALWKRIGILHKRIGQTLHAMSASRPIPIGNGRFFGRREKPGNERLDGDVMYEVVRELHGQELADKAVERTASKAQLKRALKAAGLKVAPAERAVLATVAARGGTSRKPTEVFEEFTAELQLVSGEPEPDKSEEVHESPF